jgi:hypothetical protein
MPTKTRRSVSIHRNHHNAIDVRRDEFTKVTTALRNVNNVTREEFVLTTNELRDVVHELAIQFKRFAQMQADIDMLKAALARLSA